MTNDSRNMKKRSKKTEYYGGRIKPLVEAVARLVAKDPSLAENPERLHSMIAYYGSKGNEKAKGYHDPSSCFNCGRSMKIQVYTAGVGHAMLLLAMAQAVREEMRKGIEFTKANRVHIDRLPIATSIKKQQSQAGYLGLIHQVADGKRSGYWLITKWGWAALRGESIPRAVKYWDKKLIARSQHTTTLSEMMQTHREKIEKQIRLGKAVKEMDHRSEIASYDPVEWAEYGGVVDQDLLFDAKTHHAVDTMTSGPAR